MYNSLPVGASLVVSWSVGHNTKTLISRPVEEVEERKARAEVAAVSRDVSSEKRFCSQTRVSSYAAVAQQPLTNVEKELGTLLVVCLFRSFRAHWMQK